MSDAPTDLGLIRRCADLDAPWVTAVLRASGAASEGAAVKSFEEVAIGTGQMSDSHRITLCWSGDGEAGEAGPRTIILKIASSDPTSRSTGVDLGAYEREVRFYQEAAPRVGGPVARCHHAAYDPKEGWFTLVLEDAAPAVQGDQIEGCSLEQAELAMRELAAVHAPVWDDAELGEASWLNKPLGLGTELVTGLLPGFFERYSERVAPEHQDLIRRFVPGIDEWAEDRRPPFSLQHSDYRLDNLLFGEPGSPKALTVVDWQTLSWGHPLLDAAYFVGAGLADPQERRDNERDLARIYYDELCSRGVSGFSWEQCWDEYRRQSFWGVVMSTAASMLVVRTERGDDMLMTMLARHAEQVLDLDAEATLAPRPPTAGPRRQT